MKTTIQHTLEYARFVARRFVEDRCLMIAGSLAYTSLLALVPLFAVTLTLTADVPVVRDFIVEVKAFILTNFLPDVAGRVVGVDIERFAQNATRLTVIGLAIILATAIALMFTIDNAFNDIWRTRQRRTWWKRLAAYISLLGFGPLLIGASLSVTTYVVHLTRKFDRVLPMLDDGPLTIIPFGLTMVALLLAYLAVPNRYVPNRHAVIAGGLAALLFEVVKHLFVAYIVSVPTYSLVYGAFASLPIFLLWLFCCWLVVLIGAEVAATLSYYGHVPVYRNTHAIGGNPPSVRVRDAGRIIDTLALSGVPLAFNALRLRAAMPIDAVEDVLHDLLGAKIVTRSAVGRYELVSVRADIRDEDIRAAVGAG